MRDVEIRARVRCYNCDARAETWAGVSYATQNETIIAMETPTTPEGWVLVYGYDGSYFRCGECVQKYGDGRRR